MMSTVTKGKTANIGIVICNFNKQNDVLLCIQSVLESKYEDYHIYVVDNASSDDSVSLIKQQYGDCKKLELIVNQENLGGSGGFNTGLRKAFAAGHEYLMCVDNDAMLDENCIGELHTFLDEHDDVGIAAAKIYHTGQEDYVQQYGSFIDYENYSVDSTYLNHIEDGSMPDVVYSDAVPACALMIKREVVEKIGLMPEENFLYWDDTEWCVRCKEAGYKVASVGAAAACHAMGAKKEDVNTFPTYYAWRNWIRFFLEHIDESKIDDMAQTFLGSIFEINYTGLYRGEQNRSRTVMAALDDALHGKMGKAGDDRIFDLEFTYDGLERAVGNKQSIRITAGEYPLFAEALKEKIESKWPDKQVFIVSDNADAGNFNAKDVSRYSTEDVVTHTATITLCESIFRQDDLSLATYVMDLDGNVLVDEDDVLMVINYNYSKQSFIFAMKPLFMRLAHELKVENFNKS